MTLAWRLAYPAIVEATFTPYFKVFLDREDKLPANENLPEFGRAVAFGATSATEEPASQRPTRTETLHGPHWTRERGVAEGSATNDFGSAGLLRQLAL
jgi:hypothetical protein